MNIPHKLEKLRDELAKACDDKYGYHGTEEFFVLGWNACFQALSEAAGAFDKQAAIEGPQPTPTDLPEFTVATNPSDSEIAGPRE